MPRGYVRKVDAVTNIAGGYKVILHPLVTCGLCRARRSSDGVHCEDSSFLGINADGDYVEYFKTGARSVIKLDDKLEPAEVAALADAGLTAYHMCAKAAKTSRPASVVVMIGPGGLGHVGIQVMKAINSATVDIVDPNRKALSLATKLGADHIVQAGDGDGFVK
jgi:NAD+-dependent secondary alcohol dehydrogenase Adh1